MKNNHQKNTKKLGATEQILLKLNLLILGFFILTAWIASRMTLAVYTLVHFILFIATLYVLTKGTRRKTVIYAVISFGLAGSLSAIWLTVSYASFFN